jgi:hypothetical protein
MSDTQIFGKTVTGAHKAAILYVLVDIALSLGQSMSTMEKAQWDAMWWMQRAGFWFLQIGSAGLVLKAFYSSSNEKAKI